MASIATAFTERYGVEHPIACAAMAFATLSPRLPVAVNRAGALGAFAAGPLPLEFIAANIRAIREQADGPLNLNFITPFCSDAHIELCLELRPEIVSFHWGLPPEDWLRRLQAAGLHSWQQVGNVDDARRAAALGMDAVIAQGAEAGGHCYGELPLSVLLPAVREAVAADCLVLAAGGIVDGRSLAAVLALGADAGVVGTRLLASDEADVADEYKQRLVQAGPEDTLLSSLFGRDMPDFNPMRVIRTPLVAEWQDRVDEIDPQAEQPLVGEMELAGQKLELRRFGSLLPVRGARGDFDQLPLTAGQGVGGIRDIRPAAEIIQSLVDEALAALRGLAPGEHQSR